MQFVARLHTTRKGVNTLQSVQYGSDLDSISKQAQGMLTAEPVGAWVEVSERVEVPRKTYVKRQGALLKAARNPQERDVHEEYIEEISRVAPSHVERAASAGQKPGSKANAGEK